MANKIIDFFKDNAESIIKEFKDPFFIPELNDQNKELLSYLGAAQFNWGASRNAFPGQAKGVILPITKLFLEKRSKAAIIAAKMGTGKTTMSNSIMALLFEKEYKENGMNAAFLTVGKHMNKMEREVKAVCGGIINIYKVKTNPKKRDSSEISFDEAIQIKRVPGVINYFLISKDSGKNGFKYAPMKPGQKCPDCGAKLKPTNKSKKESWYCHSCGESTSHVIGGKESFAHKLLRNRKNKHDKLFDLLIVDEVHEFANRDSLQSQLYKALVNVSYRTIVMTGTLSNGYASSVFHILYPLFARHFKKYGGFDYNKIGSFVSFFGAKKESSKVVIDRRGNERTSVKIQELPQINDRIISFMAPYTVWFGIEDLGVEMPPFSEHTRIVPLNEEISNAFRTWDTNILNFIRNRDIANFVDTRYLHLANKTYRLNNPCTEYSFNIPEIELNDTGTVLPEANINFNPLSEDFESNKEKALIQLCESELKNKRRILVYGVYNNATGLYNRLKLVLNRHNISVDIMPSNLPSEQIEEWVISDEREDVVILPQKRVATGLDLVQFQTVIFYEIDKQLKTVSQSKVRPWRPIGQDKEVKVFYLAYEGEQEKELKIMASKMRAAAIVDGEVIEDNTIASIYDYNPEMTAAIADISEQIKDNNSVVLGGGSNQDEFENFYKEIIKMYEEGSASSEEEAEEEVVDYESEFESECSEHNNTIDFSEDKMAASSQNEVGIAIDLESKQSYFVF